jgi:hypothetical protein
LSVERVFYAVTPWSNRSGTGSTAASAGAGASSRSIWGDRGFRVEAIHGSGDTAQRRNWYPPTEEDALQLVDELMGESDGWREIRTSLR